MNPTPNPREQYSAHLPALHLLCNLGGRFSTTAQAHRRCACGATMHSTQPPRLCFCMRNLGGFSFAGRGCTW